MYNWTFARITCIKKVSKSYYYGFASEMHTTYFYPPEQKVRAIWFKQGKEVPAIMLGPLAFSCDQSTSPRQGDIIVGRTSCKIDQNQDKYDWWYRDGAPLYQLASVLGGTWDRDLTALCKNTRYFPNLSLDNLWAFIRLIENGDLQSFIEEYLPPSQQHIHPLRGLSGKRGYVLDRSTYQFIIDVSIFFGCPTIYREFEILMHSQQLSLELLPHLAMEKSDFQERMDIHNNNKECYMT